MAGYIMMFAMMLHFVTYIGMKAKQEKKYKANTKHEPAIISYKLAKVLFMQ